MTNMKLVIIFVFISSCIVFTIAEDIVCKKRMKTTVQVAAGESFSFKTQAGRQYMPGTKCVAKYKKSSSCKSMRFSCSKFSVKNKTPNCSRGDRMVVVADGEIKRFCQENAPDVTTSGDLRVLFITNKAKQSSGAECSVECAPEIDGLGSCAGCVQEAQVSPLIQNLAKFAVNHQDFPSLAASSCSETVQVLDVSTQVVAGTNYFLTLKISTRFGPNCSDIITSICGGVNIFHPLPVYCQGAADNCDQLLNSDNIICTDTSTQPASPPAPAFPSCLCPALFAPVCAEDGQTYGNSCSAACQGSKTRCSGECPCQ